MEEKEQSIRKVSSYSWVLKLRTIIIIISCGLPAQSL